MATIEWTEPDDPSGRELDDLRAAPVVALEWHEAAMAARVGLSRQLNALAAGKPEADGRGDEPGWNHHVEGALGELAAAKYLGLYWSGSVNTYKFGGDVGAKIQVRTRSECWYGLKIKKTDRDADIFVLVLGRCPVYHVRGWCYAGDAKAHLDAHPEAKKTWVLDPAGRGSPNIFVPQSALRPMADLLADRTPPPGLAPLPAAGYRTSVRRLGCPACRPRHEALRTAGRGAK